MVYFLFSMGTLPIILAVLIFGLLVGRWAKKRGKNSWSWGIASICIVTSICWKPLPTLAAHIYNIEMQAIQFMKPKGSVTTLAEAKKINLSSRVGGVDFDVPLTYIVRGYNRKDGGWLDLPKGEVDGTERPEFDYINIYALMPDLAPLREDNISDFEVGSHGRKVRASLTHIVRPWDDYFHNVLPNAEKRVESPDAPGMFHYYENGSMDIYLSDNYPTPDLTRISCRDQSSDPVPFPACTIETSYHPPSSLLKPLHKEGKWFRLEYTFSIQYLSQWRYIDKGLKSLFDQFILDAAKRSSIIGSI